ncbi:MAG TPA: SEC-C metal-binding domain-containing protein, partial [Planctomycetaceae bacterium]
EELDEKDPAEAKRFVLERLEAMYREKEVLFPVAVGMTKYMADGPGGGADRHDKEGLVRWASGRFQTRLDPEAVKSKPRQEIERLLAEASRRYFVNGEATEQVDRYLDEAYGDGDGPPPEHPEKIDELLAWANQQFHADLNRGEVATLPKPQVRQKLIHLYETRYRPELSHAERALVLDVLDFAWKEHLYYMDHLRSGIGLVGYAQKDPKVEYKREGRKAFLAMWDRIDEQVTGAIFRLEKESPAFVSELWQITSETHAAPAEAQPEPQQIQESGGSNQPEPGAPAKAVDPIKNVVPKVGRNDPCPCGSGKKYKKCCGANA